MGEFKNGAEKTGKEEGVKGGGEEKRRKGGELIKLVSKE